MYYGEVINAYTANSVENGNQALYTVKVMISVIDKKTYFNLYRCAHPITPNQSINIDDLGVPQGEPLYGTDDELKTIVKLLFPILTRLDAEPMPY